MNNTETSTWITDHLPESPAVVWITYLLPLMNVKYTKPGAPMVIGSPLATNKFTILSLHGCQSLHRKHIPEMNMLQTEIQK